MEYKTDLDKLRHSCSHVMAQATRLTFVLLVLTTSICAIGKAEITPDIKGGLWVEAEDAAIAGDFEKAESILRKILPTITDQLEMESANDSLEIINNYKQGLLNTEPVVYFFKAMKYFGAGDYEGAIVELQNAADLAPSIWLLQKYLAWAYFTTDNLEKAAYYAQKVIEKNKEDGRASWVLCITYGTDEKVSVKPLEALEYCKRAEMVMPSDPYVLDKLAYVYFELGDCSSALLNFKKAMEIDADCPALKFSYLFMGMCAHSLGQSQEAIDYFHEAIKLNPGHTEIGLSAHGFLVTIYTNLEDHTRASAELQEIKDNCDGCSEEQVKEMVEQLKEGLTKMAGRGI